MDVQKAYVSPALKVHASAGMSTCTSAVVLDLQLAAVCGCG